MYQNWLGKNGIKIKYTIRTMHSLRFVVLYLSWDHGLLRPYHSLVQRYNYVGASEAILLWVNDKHWPSDTHNVTAAKQNKISASLLWRHNDRGGVSDHQLHDCLLSRLFRRRSKKTSKIRVTGLCVGNSPGTGEFPAQMASNSGNASIWWRHHDTFWDIL